MYKLGKTPARPGAVKLRLTDYLTTAKLPTPPKAYTHAGLVNTWGMLGNDQFGDCVWAGAAHETMLWNREAGKSVAFDNTHVLGDYSAVTGFNIKDRDTDQGTDMQAAASYRQKVGVIDTKAVRHKVAAYLAITPGDVAEHKLAMYLFGAVGIGIEFPESAMEQFNNGEPWHTIKGAQIAGGHYIPLVAFDSLSMTCVTWGKLQKMTNAFFKKYNDESIVYLSTEMLAGGKTLDGFDLAQLQTDLAALR